MLESAAANWLAAVGRAGDDWAIAAADISTGRFELVACGPGELAAELARLSPAETIADATVPGIRTTAGKGGFDSLAGERALKARFGLATLDGLGAPSRAELAAAGGLLAYLDATQKGARHPARRAAPDRARRATWRSTPRPATASSLTRSVGGSVAGSLLGEIDRCQTAAGRRLLAEDIVRAADRPAGDRGAAGAGRTGCTTMRSAASGVRAALKAMPDFAPRARRGWPPGAAARATSRCCATAWPPPRRSSASSKAKPDRPPLLDALLPRLGGHDALVDQLARALVDSPPIDASKGGYIAEGYDAALDALARRRVERPPRDRRARGALSRRDRRRVAQDPPQCGARLSYRGRRRGTPTG